MVANSPALPNDLVLDVAAGTSLFGRALAPLVRAVVALDITTQMLRAGKAAAERAGIPNILFEVGDAEVLPFPDETFDRVISRLAMHHFENRLAVLHEMRRVCRTNGTVTVIDMIVPADADALAFNELERLRDPSHAEALTGTELRSAIASAGLSITHTSNWLNVLDGERWLEQTDTPEPNSRTIRGAWSAELRGGRNTGMSPRVQNSRIEIVHHWDLVVAQRVGA
jgi:ubiquinone/menaquinone biosynthesis C-methylase UbiE